MMRSSSGRNLNVLPNNHGPQTDRLVYGLGPFKGYASGDPTSREVGLYDQPFVDTFIHMLSNGGRVIAGQFDDPYQLDEKGIFDLVNLNTNDLGGIPGARRPPGKEVFTGFNLFSIALEVPIEDVFPHGIPHDRRRRHVPLQWIGRVAADTWECRHENVGLTGEAADPVTASCAQRARSSACEPSRSLTCRRALRHGC